MPLCNFIRMLSKFILGKINILYQIKHIQNIRNNKDTDGQWLNI